MIQDIAPKHFDNTYLPRSPKPDDYVFSYVGKQAILKQDHTFYQVKDFSSLEGYTYLFAIDTTAFYLKEMNDTKATTIPLQQLRTLSPRELSFACITGWHLYEWLQHNRFCGQCGETMEPSQSERAMVCPHCGHIVYPRLNPAVIVGVINEKHQLLVTKYAHSQYTHHALVAGYAEIGETIEECVKREVYEETGLMVDRITYYKSQPWAFSESLLFGFWCHVTGSETIHLDTNELKIAEWKSPQDDFDIVDNASLTAEMIQCFQTGGIS